MGLLSFFKRSEASQAVGGPADDVQQARTRARQRLIGAIVLLGVGIIGFPLVFETQPRPIPVDIPIEIPRKENAPPLSIPPAARPATEPQATAGPALDDIVTEPRDPSASEPAARAAPKSPPRAELHPVPSPARPSTSDARTGAEAKPATADDGARARALLDGGAPAASAPARFVVQVGAFADASSAHDTRLKVEKLGLKTYTQVASTAAGGRIRVRVGPFGTREEADRALAKARGAGLAAVVITL